eukprot:TRINITY_DN7726_c1_g1_i2.p2 TRINITY_DN7726_c1_g1~~TRINITY_DN7726_c1_g1_i2.p2  ORF type:complete len:121 (-),score=34.41 TRINITY_DN7726_c1_g1_i2:429-791(-)
MARKRVTVRVTKDQMGDNQEHEVDPDIQWLPQNIIQCGKATGVLVDESRGGWSAMVEFAQRREEQNREELRKENAKRKGERELNSLSCSINYERNKNLQTEKSNSGKGGRRIQGDFSSSK